MNLWNDRRRVSKIIADRFGDDYARDLPPFTDRLLDPSHVSRELTDSSIGAAGTLQFKDKERSALINSEDVDGSYC